MRPSTISGTKPFAHGTYEVKVHYGGKPGIAARPPWTGGFQWSTDGQNDPWISVTCQARASLFPCKKDHLADNEGADEYVPQGLTVTAPGLLKKVKNNENGKGTTTFHWSKSISAIDHCVFNVGKYKKVSRTYTSIDHNKIPLDFYVLEEHSANADRLLDFVERSCRVLEKYFGEYPRREDRRPRDAPPGHGASDDGRLRKQVPAQL